MFLSEKLSAAKIDIFVNVMRECGLRADAKSALCTDLRFEEAGYSLIENLLDSGKTPPTAFIAAYDEIAVGAMKALFERGYKIPGDISVMGINDIPSSRYGNPPLTTVGFDKKTMCKSAVRLLLERILNPQAPSAPRLIQVEHNLIARGTTAKRKADKTP
jgi:LacI family transcriptional regulator